MGGRKERKEDGREGEEQGEKVQYTLQRRKEGEGSQPLLWLPYLAVGCSPVSLSVNLQQDL